MLADGDGCEIESAGKYEQEDVLEVPPYVQAAQSRGHKWAPAW